MKNKKTKKERKRLIFISFTILVLIFFLVFSVSGDFKKIMNNKNSKVELTLEYEKLLDDEKKLESEITKMQDPEYLARYAKEKYLFSSPGELIIRID